MEKEKGGETMRGRRYNLNIDRLEVCYEASREVINSLEDTLSWEREGYRLQEHFKDKIETILKIEVILTLIMKWENFLVKQVNIMVKELLRSIQLD